MNKKSLTLYAIRQLSKNLKNLIPGKQATKVLQNYKVSIDVFTIQGPVQFVICCSLGPLSTNVLHKFSLPMTLDSRSD